LLSWLAMAMTLCARLTRASFSWVWLQVWTIASLGLLLRARRTGRVIVEDLWV
jgi:hypothetical protein